MITKISTVPKTTNIERYEKHIASLEERIDFLEKSNQQLQDKCNKISKEKETARLQSLQSVSAFMSKLYSDLGAIQGELLKHIATINKRLNKEHSDRAAELLREMSKLFAIEDRSPSKDDCEIDDDDE